MKAILLAGGKGTRLWPLTQAISKQLLPVYDKPMIYYPLSTIMLAGIREVLIITDPENISQYKKLLGDGMSLGMKIMYAVQNEPEGIPQAILIGAQFLESDDCMLVLGDNILSGNFTGRHLQQFTNIKGCMILTKKVENYQDFGILEIDKNGKFELVEKPTNSKSKQAITGIYFLDNSCIEKTAKLSKSKRGELEIVDLLSMYVEENNLRHFALPLGSVWLDTGTTKGLNEAAEYVRIIQHRQNFPIASVELIAYQNGWISHYDVLELISKMPDSAYSHNIKKFLEEAK